ncbi:MAG: gamma-glutamyltransferase [Steroidobacteraceae bacterium]|nr:gamma-glutamyltransferase [Steroidobacteraceae bacterium]MDW8260448.1 gamma-glutamyltransferase [Gammaproteobacteria bacterium]
MRRPALRVLIVVACSVLWWGGSAVAQPSAARPGKAAIASAHPLATEAGHEILRAGGNAFDAAVAIAAALAVVEPSGSGLGGGGFFLLHRAADRFEVMIDAREKAPLAATRDMFLDERGEPIPRLSLDSALAAGIPGEPAALAHLSDRYGRLPLARSLQPAIRLARDGFPMYARLQAIIQQKRAVLYRQPHARRIWLDARGEVPALGTVIRQPALARTLERLAVRGVAEFYTGQIARQMLREVKALGGIWSEQDLAAYRVVERAPIVGHYRGARIVSAAPPAAGGIALINALNILSGYDLEQLDRVTRVHVIVEAMRRMHRDRAIYLGDPDFVSIPIELLTSPAYAAGQRAALNLTRALPSELLPGVAPAQPAGTQTTHFSVLDADGNRVGATITLNFLLGSGLMLKTSGIFLNNQMDDFSIKPGVPNGFQLLGAEANAIAPGKRMLSSSTPTFVESEHGLMIAGTPGGSYITGMVLLATLDFLRGRSAAQIVAAPRFHHQYLPDVLQVESGALSDAERAALAARGHQIRELRRRWGNMQIVVWDYASGTVEAASDPRGEGAGQVY